MENTAVALTAQPKQSQGVSLDVTKRALKERRGHSLPGCLVTEQGEIILN